MLFPLASVIGHCRLNIAHAALGFEEKAIEKGKYGVKLTQETKPANSP